MNERIRELWSQAEEEIKAEYEDESCRNRRLYNEIFLPKFAELIVQECIHALWTEECRTNAMTQAEYERGGNRIHKHFWG